MSVINYNDYKDAKAIIKNIESEHSILSGIGKDRMNEVKPHFKWANKVLSMAKIFGVLNKGVDFNELYRI